MQLAGSRRNPVGAGRQEKDDVTTHAEKRSAARRLPKLEDFPHRTKDIIRYRDLDGNSHVNNAVFSTLFESGRVTLFRPPERGLMPEGWIWTLARIEIDYLGEMQWPCSAETGIGLVALGHTSAVFDQAIFFADRCVATARAINVLIDFASRRPVPIPDAVRRNFERWKMALTPAARAP
jgi:acyl-CoA thioester hydrolase